jgi:hypothetical protein
MSSSGSRSRRHEHRRLHRKAGAADPDPRVEAGTVKAASEVKQVE